MTIQDYIKSYFENSIGQSTNLVVYDPDEKYRDIIESITDYEIIDASQSTILGRERALELWSEMGSQPQKYKGLLIYLPIARPKNTQQLLENPYLMFEIAGAVFPQSDADTFKTLCHKAFPDKIAQIDKIFESDQNPDFETINTAIKTDQGWPVLRNLLKVESTEEILIALLSPGVTQLAALNSSTTWLNEYQEFMKIAIGYSVLSKSKKWDTLKDELWRYVLFSEFVFDLPTHLPAKLSNVPQADEKQRSIIYTVCENLRLHERHQELYLIQATGIANSLNMEKFCAHIEEFGKRDTFEFEERTFLSVFARKVLSGKINEAEKIYRERANSIWAKNTNERQLFWTIAERSLKLKTVISETNILISEYSANLSDLFTGYYEKFYRVDKLHRDFEQVISDLYRNWGPFEDLIFGLRKEYLTFTENLQQMFINHVKNEGWPINNQLRNTLIFDYYVEPHLKQRQKVAFFMVDALRYELAVELESKLNSKYKVELKPVCAQLPTTTKMGMASLMPQADGNLYLKTERGEINPVLAGKIISIPDERMNFIRSIYGDICHSIWLDDFFGQQSLHIPATNNLLLIKTKDIDDLGEHIPNEAAALIPRMLQKLFYAVNKLFEMGYQHIVFATDHGFILKDSFSIGDNIEKPSGDWIEVKSRCLLGKGSNNDFTVAFAPEFVGIKCDCTTYVVPKKCGAFKKGSIYYHEGLSLQECVLPVLSISMEKSVKDELLTVDVNIGYKGGKTNEITTRRPMIELSVLSDDLFAEIDVQLEAYSGNNVIGEPAACSALNPATNLLKLQAGKSIKIALKMEEDFEGEFEVRAIDPITQITYSSIKLKTNYMD